MAVNSTFCPTTCGFGEEMRPVVVATGCVFRTDWLMLAVLPRCPLVGKYCAVTEAVPKLRLVLTYDPTEVAAPVGDSGMNGDCQPGALKRTVPVGVPTPALTVASNVTYSPSCDGLRFDVTLVVVGSCASTLVAGTLSRPRAS